MSYERHIASSLWRQLRAEALKRDGYRCRLCDSSEDLEVHHRRYPQLGQWNLARVENLTTPCAECHEVVTCRQREKRYGSLLHAGAEVFRVVPAIEVAHE